MHIESLLQTSTTELVIIGTCVPALSGHCHSQSGIHPLHQICWRQQPVKQCLDQIVLEGSVAARSRRLSVQAALDARTASIYTLLWSPVVIHGQQREPPLISALVQPLDRWTAEPCNKTLSAVPLWWQKALVPAESVKASSTQSVGGKVNMDLQSRRLLVTTCSCLDQHW